MNICENIFINAKLFERHPAIVFDDRTLSYESIEQLSSRAAQVLIDRGIKSGDRVGLVLPNVPAFVVWYYATLRIGAIAVAISTRLTPDEVAFMLNDCQARVVVIPEDNGDSIQTQLPRCVEHVLPVSNWADRLDDRPLDDCPCLASISCVDLPPDTPATILYTSGTTGFPKGATLSHQNVRATVHAFNHLCKMGHEDRLLLAVPLFHCYGQNALLNSGLNVGATIVMQRKFDLNESQRLIVDHEITKLFGVPTTFQLICDCYEPADLESVEYCFSAAAALPIQLSHRWQEKFGMPIFEGYGLTETSPFASYNHRDHFVSGSIGTPVDLVEMKIVDTDTGEACPPGTLGEIAIRGPNVMLGYWNRPDETAAAIRDGWFHSGDIGRVDEFGFFHIVDRVKDMISVGGMKVFPAEVERILLDHPGVAQAAVVGFPDAVFGESVVAFIMPMEEPVDSNELQDHCRKHLASYKVPRQVVQIEEMPRNPTGKILKTQLREINISTVETTIASAGPIESGLSGPQHSSEGGAGCAADTPGMALLAQRIEKVHKVGRQQAIVAIIMEEMRQIVGERDLPSAEQKLAETELDSLAIIELCERLQRMVGDQFKIAPTLVFDHPRIIDLAAFLLEKLDASGQAATDQADAEPRVLQGRPSPADSKGPADGLTQDATDSDIATGKVEAMSEQEAMQALLRELAD